MSKTKIFLWRSLVIIGALCILNLPFTVRAQGGSSVEDLNELKATVNIQVSWSKHDEYHSCLEETGSMSTSVTGTLTLGQQGHGVFFFFPGSKGMNAVVNYQNETKDKETGEFYSSEKGSGSAQVDGFVFIAFTGLGARLHAQQLSGQVDIDSLSEAMTSQENMDHYLKEAMTSQENMDHYTFTVQTTIQTVCTDKDGNSHEGLEGIHFDLWAEALKGGANSNSLSWTAQKKDCSIGHQNFMGTVYYPPKSGDVKYTVSWTFGEVPPVVEIQREVEGRWVDITDKTVQVVVGEKMKLRGVVVPEDKDSKQGKWSISDDGDSEHKKYIKKFHAELNYSEVVPIDPQKDLEKPEVLFFWVDQGSGKVTYKTTAAGKQLELEETVNFEIMKPKFTFGTEAKQYNNYGILNLGEKAPSGECCVPPRTKKDQQAEDDIREKYEKLKKELKTLNENDAWDMRIKQKIIQELSDLGCWGIQYGGISFCAEPQDDTPGEVQFVQTLFRKIENKDSNGKSKVETIQDALDGCYPYPKNIGEYGTYDSPGFSEMGGTSYKVVDLEFDMYLMFMPAGEGNEWVPLKKAHWSWSGAIDCINGKCTEDEGARFFPQSIEAPDCSEYPIWHICSFGE